MVRTQVASTNIRSIGYDAGSQLLEIEFNSGGVYGYVGVSAGEFEELMGAESKGRYFNANIKNRYSFVKS